MESIGERITRLRTGKGWSRPELGRRMAKAINREKPFSGEAIRRYEEGIDSPRRDGRLALSKVFERTEAFMEFGESDRGDSRDPGEAPLTEAEADLVKRYRAAEPRWQLSMRLLSYVATEKQNEVAGMVNVIIAKAFGKAPHEIKPIHGRRVKKAFGDAPHVAARREPLLKVQSDRAQVKKPRQVKTS